MFPFILNCARKIWEFDCLAYRSKKSEKKNLESMNEVPEWPAQVLQFFRCTLLAVFKVKISLNLIVYPQIKV